MISIFVHYNILLAYQNKESLKLISPSLCEIDKRACTFGFVSSLFAIVIISIMFTMSHIPLFFITKFKKIVIIPSLKIIDGRFAIISINLLFLLVWVSIIIVWLAIDNEY